MPRRIRIIRISRKQNKSGYIYAIRGDDGYTKIGLSVDPKERLESLRREYGDRSLQIYAAFKVENMLKTERELHGLYSQKSVGGEWFDLSQGELDGFCAMLSEGGAK
jgi:hypothetical protein